MIVQISAGQGPSECQLAVAKLFEALQKEYGAPYAGSIKGRIAFA